MSKVCQSIKNEIYLNQKKRIENGEIVKYKDGKEYLVSPGYTTVSKGALGSYLKGFGMADLAKMIS